MSGDEKSVQVGPPIKLPDRSSPSEAGRQNLQAAFENLLRQHDPKNHREVRQDLGEVDLGNGAMVGQELFVISYASELPDGGCLNPGRE